MLVPGGTVKHTVPLPSAVSVVVVAPIVTFTDAPDIGMPSSSTNWMALENTPPQDTGPLTGAE